MMHLLLAATLAAPWPPEADTAEVCLLRDGVPQSCVYSPMACAIWNQTIALGSAYSAIACDTSGNCAVGNVLGGNNILDPVCDRRELTGQPCP